MAYEPYAAKRRQNRSYFEARREQFPGLSERLDELSEGQTLGAARDLLREFFERHRPGDVRSLRQIASAFADKRLARSFVDEILGDEPLQRQIAARSYPHPIGFHKLVLHEQEEGPARGFKLRLHIYWRTPQEVAAELIHLHRFEMASSPITGELTNHMYVVRRFAADKAFAAPGEGATRTLHAYTGYERDAGGHLHKRWLGEAELALEHVVTLVPGQSYAQRLESPHFVETNAETGHTNGDVCSTLYIHGPKLADGRGRRLPVLFEPIRVPDTRVTPADTFEPSALVAGLERYRSLLDESIRFYDWLYHPRYGRNLSVGMVAGYFLCEAFSTARVIEMWERHRPACVEVLRARGATLARLVRKELLVEQLPRGDRDTRYLQQLINKSWDHAGGQADFLAQYGDLVKEFGRYLGALLGDYARDPHSKVLKPIWDLGVRDLHGGAHYGRIWAMLEAARAVEPLLIDPGQVASRQKGEEGPVSDLDVAVQERIRALLAEHFPRTGFRGEEGPGADAGATRWLVDSIDGTRNLLEGDPTFAVSIAHQVRRDAAWLTTDAVVALPTRGEIYWAERGQGAFLIRRDGEERRLRIPSREGDLRGRLVELSLRGLGIEGELAVHRALIERGAVRRTLGSAALGFCLCAHARAGALVTANDYDVAAGLLVAEEAGAMLSTIDFRREARDFRVYIASHAAYHDELAAIVRAALAPPGEADVTTGLAITT